MYHYPNTGSVPRETPGTCRRRAQTSTERTTGPTRPTTPTPKTTQPATAINRRQLSATALSSLLLPSLAGPARAALAPTTSTFASNAFGFQFSYPSSFVVAFDRTDSYAPRSIPADEDIALTSVGSYRKAFLTVTVFAKRVGTNVSPAGSKDFFYDRVIQPVVDEPTTIGFTLNSEAYGGDAAYDRYYDFEFVHSVCRGETIEGKSGALRCIGDYGQDLPIQSRIVLGRSIVRDGVLLTLMGSIRTERGDVEGGMAEERQAILDIIGSFTTTSR